MKKKEVNTNKESKTLKESKVVRTDTANKNRLVQQVCYPEGSQLVSVFFLTFICSKNDYLMYCAIAN